MHHWKTISMIWSRKSPTSKTNRFWTGYPQQYREYFTPFPLFSICFTQAVHNQNLLKDQDIFEISAALRVGFPQLYTQRVENTFSTFGNYSKIYQQVFRILTGTLADFSPCCQHKDILRIKQNDPCEKPDSSKQVFLQQNTAFQCGTLQKNRMISAKNRLSTSAQAPTAAASATIPYSYLTLSVRLRERISDRERSMCKTSRHLLC